MSQRLVAIIDADLNLATHLSGELQRYGLTVEVSTDSNELMARKEGLPDLVVLCIDPKRTGWAVCNRLRKSPSLKSIPLVITSAEATEKDFDDHKKLKTRAEEYLHKPFSAEALIDKISTLIGLPELEADAGEIEVEAEEIGVDLEAEELGVEVAGDDEMTVGGRNQPAQPSFDTGEDESTRIGFTAEIDGEVDLETNAAFAAIGLDEPQEQAAPDAETASPFDDDPFGLPEPPAAESPAHAEAPAMLIEDAATPAEAPAMLVEDAEAPAERPPAPLIATSPPPPADMDSAPVPRLAIDDLDLGLEEVARDAAALVASSPPPPNPAQAGGANTAALDDARREIERLRKEMEELRARPKAEAASAAGFSREREFLTLRETINKKEKEVLDLRDSLDSKERAILDNKDKLRDAERKRGEVEERSLSTERELVAAREKVEALAADKERAVEREKQVKGRLEDTQRSVHRLEQELEQWRGKHAQDTAALDAKHEATVAKHREDMGSLRQTNAEALADLTTNHQSVVANERTARESEKQALLERHSDEMRQQSEAHAQTLAQQAAEHAQRLEAEVKASERRHAEALVDLEGQHEQQVAAHGAKHQEALRAHAEEARRTLEQAVADHLTERGRLEADHARTVETLDAAKIDALAAAATEANQQFEAALAQKTAEHEAELKAAREQGARKLQALEESHEDLRAGMQARHGAALDEVKKQHATTIGEFEAAITERDTLLGQQRDRHTELEAAHAAEQQRSQTHAQTIETLASQQEAAQNELDARSKALEERAHRIAELEQESARYQDQILRAYQRIKADESIVARAKKALAIALTLLEESDDGNEEASS